MVNSTDSARRSGRGPTASSLRSMRGLLTLGGCLAALLIAAVVGANSSGAQFGAEARRSADRASDHATLVQAGVGTAPQSRAALDAMLQEFERVRPELLADFACAAGGNDGEWFDWDRLERNFPDGPDETNIQSSYGITVDVSGNVAVVGASRQVFLIENPDPNEPPIEIANSGAAYIFRFVEGEWVRVAEIEPPMSSLRFRGCQHPDDKSPNPPQNIPNIRFGSAVAVANSPDRDVVVIGAPFEPFLFKDEDQFGTCVVGGLPQSGAVYVYERTGATAPDVEEEEWTLMPGVSENYHFGIDNVQIIQEDKLWSNFPFEGSRFGSSVSVLPFRLTEDGWEGGNMIAGGAPTAVAFPNCEEADNPGWFSGTITTFEFGGTLPEGGTFPDRWVMGESLTSECFPFDQFGANVAFEYSRDRQRPTILSGISQGIAWVPHPDDPKEDDEPIFNAGTVLLFEFDPPEDDDEDNGRRLVRRFSLEGDDEKEEEVEPAWKLMDVFQSPNPRPGELFGVSVAFISSPIDNDLVVIGSRRAYAFVDEDGECDLDFSDCLAGEGAVYIFRRHFVSEAVLDDPEEEEYEWESEAKLISIDPQNAGWFGDSVAGFGNTIVVGAPREGMEDPDDPDVLIQAIGFAYVFSYNRMNEEWDNGELLLPYGPHIMRQFDQFGFSVATGGGATVVGAPNANWPFWNPGPPGEWEFHSVGAAFSYGKCFECESPQSCFQPGALGGCESRECCNLVCQYDPSCCLVAWDQHCVDAAAELTEQCPAPVPNCPSFGSCCDATGTPGCNTESCCEAVCAIDIFCCETEWDSCCVALAGEVCGGLCPGAEPSCEGFCGFADADGCDHTCSCAEDCNVEGNCCADVCTHCGDEPGFEWCPPMPECPGLGDCCKPGGGVGCIDEDCCIAVCTEEPSCCTDTWSTCCVALAAQLCDDVCPDGFSCEGRCGDDDLDDCGICSCASDCGENDNLPCCDDVCDHCDDEPGFEWCTVLPPGTGDCCEANGTAGCSDGPCQNAVCAVDLFCCEVDWDACCARLAEEHCPSCPVTPDPSCLGFCGVADVDGCDTCSCASDCILFGDCCVSEQDVCDHCEGEPGFDWCPIPQPPRPSPNPTSPAVESNPRPTSPVGRIEPDHALGTSSTAPKRR